MADSEDSILCDTLVRLGLVGSAQIQRAERAIQESASHSSVVSFLLDRGIIEQEDLDRARAVASEAGSSPEALLGMTIGGFQIEKVLGQGGMGVVYRATELSLERPVALKVLPPSLAADTAYLQRFEREAKAAAKIHHPAVATIFAVGSDGPHQFIAMELLDGGTLKERIVGYGVPGEAERRAFLAQILDGLSQAHKLGVIHRDLKPDNILLTVDGRPKIADFGIARDITANGQVTLTGSGMMGSPLYMAPELWEGKPAGVQTDLWALGITYWFACEGRFPFHAKSPMEISRLVTQKDLPYKEFRDPVDRKVLSLLLARKPEKRAKSCLEVLAALRPHTSVGSASLLAVTSSQRLPAKHTPLASQLLQQTVSKTRGFLLSPKGPGGVFVASTAGVLTGAGLLFLGGVWPIVGGSMAGVSVMGLLGSLALQRSQRTGDTARLIPPGSTYNALIEASNALGRSTRLEAEPTIPVAPRGGTTRMDSGELAEAKAGAESARRAAAPESGKPSRAAAASGASGALPATKPRKRKSGPPASPVRKPVKRERGAAATTIKSQRSDPASVATLDEQPADASQDRKSKQPRRKTPSTPPGASMSNGEGRTIVVPRDVPTIHEALTQAGSGDTVYVSAGRYSMEPSVLGDGVTLAGQSEEAVTVIGDAAKGALITFKRVGGRAQIKNITFTLQNSGDEEAGKRNELIRLRAGEVKLDHLTVRGTPGHAIRAHGEAQVRAQALNISGCKKHGLTVSGGASITINESHIEKCEEGGALSMDSGSTLTMRSCELSACEKYGVAARTGGHARLEQCKVTNHRQYGVLSGDAGSVMELVETQASGNAKHGALALGGGTLKIQGGLLQGNGQAGAAGQNTDSKLHVTGANARENKAYGFYLAAGATGEFQGCNCFTNKESGAAVVDQGSRAHFQDCHLSDNGASGLTVRKQGYAKLERTNARGNPSFGAIASDDATLEVHEGEYNDNGSFGLVYMKGSNGRAEDATCKRNRKSGAGVLGAGSKPELVRLRCEQNSEYGIFINGGAAPSIEECACEKNTESGIAVWDEGTEPTIRNTTCRANSRFGIVMAGGCAGLLDGNTCNGNHAAGIFLQDAGTSPILRNNSAIGNVKVGIFINKETDPVLEWNVANGNPESNIADERAG